MTKIKQNFTLNQQDLDDIAAKAIEIGSPGPRGRSAGLRAIIAEWRRYEAERDVRTDRAMAALGYDRAARIAAQEARLDAQERHEEAEGR